MTCYFFSKETEKFHLLVAVMLLLLFMSPLIILGEHAHIRIHDNLDSNIAWYRILRNSGQLFAPIDATIPQVMNGISRNAFGSEWSGIVWLNMLFPAMIAFTINQLISRLLAFIGMYLLLKKHFIQAKSEYFIRIYVSLAFALTPFWPSGMLSTLGMPLALWAFLNIRKGEHSWKEWLTLVFLPFYASFVLGFFFFLTFVALLWLWDLIIKKRWNGKFLFSILLMTFIFLLIEYRFVSSLLLPHELTNRNEFWSSRLGLLHTIRLIFKNYLLGHTHVMTLHTLVIVPLSFLTIWILIKEKKKQSSRYFLWLFALNFLLSVWYAFWFYQGWQQLKQQISLFNTFNFARFHFLRPMIIYLMFAVGCSILWSKKADWQRLVKFALVSQIIVLFIANPELYYRSVSAPSFQEFYAEKQFEQIAKTIGEPKESYRVVSIGIHPAIAQYNGFYTVDSYNNFYPLTYKYQFRKIIAKELEKNKKLQDYYDHWGGRAYIFVSELGKNYAFEKNSTQVIKHIELNSEILWQMGGRYVLSALEIRNAQENQLTLVKVFEDQKSAWKIFLYKLIPSTT